MLDRFRFAFVTCTAQADIVRRVAPRFEAVADVRAYESTLDRDAAEGLLPALLESSPHVVVAAPKLAPPLRERLKAVVVPFEFAPDVVAARLDEALQNSSSVAIVPAAGTVSAAFGRLARRQAGQVHILPWDSHEHLRDLIVRCCRMGIETVIGGERAVSLAREEGMQGLCLNDRPDEADGAISRAVFDAAVRWAPFWSGQGEALAVWNLVFEMLTCGSIVQGDTVLIVDQRGRVVHVFSRHGQAGTGTEPQPQSLIGLPLMDLINSGPLATLERENAPLHLEFFPISTTPAGGCLVVARATPGLARSPNLRVVEPGSMHVERLLQRMDTFLERSEMLAPSRSPDRTPRRFLGSHRRRTFLLDWNRVRYFQLQSGLVHAAMANGESYATNYSLTDITERTDPRDFFRIHRDVIVNLNYVTEVERYGQGQLRVVLEGPDATAFVVSRPASVALRKLLKY